MKMQILRTKTKDILFDGGYTYVGVLFILANMGLTLALVSTLWSYLQQREKERELLFIGNQFRKAISQYYELTPGTVKTYPSSLNDLLQDNRYVSIKRYLRKVYKDPMTSNAWGIVNAPQGGIMGVYSTSNDKPIKQNGFREVDLLFVNQKHYSGWEFTYTPLLNVTANK